MLKTSLSRLSISVLTLLSIASYPSIIRGSETITDFPLGYYVDEANIYDHDPIYYKLIVGDDYDVGSDIIIKVIPLDYDSDPDIYISKTNHYPNNSMNSEWKCASYGKDTCTIHSSKISPGDNFYFGVTCPIGTCNIQIITMQEWEFELEDGVEYQSYFAEEEAKIFTFFLPTTLPDDAHFTIIGAPQKGSAKDFVLTVMSNEYDDDAVASTNYQSRKGIPAWKQGQVIRLSKDTYPEGWCGGCELSILFDVYDAGYYNILVKSHLADQFVHNNTQVDDVVSFGLRQCYRYYVKGNDTDFQVQLHAFSGSVELRAHPESAPTNWDDFKIKTDNDYETILDIDRFDRNRAGLLQGLYYICVKGDLTSTYTMVFREFIPNLAHSIVYDGYSEHFNLEPFEQKIHFYEVPPLEYDKESIKIEFDITVKSGSNDPVIGVVECESRLSVCAEQATAKELMSSSSLFYKPTATGQLHKTLMDHDDWIDCTTYNGTCYYMVVVINQAQSNLNYKLLITHGQNNNVILTENTPHVDASDMQEYKHFQFTLINATDVDKVSIEVSAHHGDSDLFVSRTFTFPDREDYDKKSQRTGSLIDYVTYSKTDGVDLAGPYYIAIYAYTYASYSVTAYVHRAGDKTEKDLKKRATLLFQSIPITKKFTEFDAMFLAYFDVDLDSDDDYSIFINLKNIEAKSIAYVKYGDVPTKNDHHFKLNSGILEIKSKTANYHTNGRYFILVKPHPDLLEALVEIVTKVEFTFQLSWRAENSVPLVHTQGTTDVFTPGKTYSYLRHYLMDDKNNVKISLLTTGKQDIFVSVQENNKQPTERKFDFSTKNSTGSGNQNAKTLLISADKMSDINMDCYWVGLGEEESCILYIGIYCYETTSCTSVIDLEYDTEEPIMVYSGQRKHHTMDRDQFVYYYLPMSRDEPSDVFAMVKFYKGTADMYVMMERYFIRDDEELSLPFTNDGYSNYAQANLHGQLLHITKEEVALCDTLLEDEEYDSHGNRFCYLIFVIAPDYLSPDQHVVYDFVAYKDMMELKDHLPIMSSASAGSYTYFFYEESCIDCTIIFSLTSQQEGDVELYVNKGSKLPNSKDFNFRKSTAFSQLLTINQESEYFKRGSSNMTGFYTIGVYSLYNTVFELGVTSEVEPVTQIQSGISIKHTQSANEIVYYRYYHWYDTDVLIQPAIQSGWIDLYVNTFNDNNENFIDRLPSSPFKSTWQSSEILPINYLDGKEILILKNDRRYCHDCYYLIGVRTVTSNAMYNLLVTSLSAESQATHLLKVGETKQIKMNKTHNQTYKFIVESRDRTVITPTIIKGQARIILAENNRGHNLITEDNGKALVMDLPMADFEYFLIVECLTAEAELSLLVYQHQTVITLVDGMPQSLHYSDFNEGSKFMILNLPTGNNTIQINVKSKTKGFYPHLYMGIFAGDEYEHIDFGKPGMWQRTSFYIFNNWNRDLGMMRFTQSLYNVQPNSVLAVNMMYFTLNQYTQEQIQQSAGDVVLTLSHSKVYKLMESENFYGELEAGGYSFNLFQLDIPLNASVVIQHSDCVGRTQMVLTRNIQDISKGRMELPITSQNGYNNAIIRNLSGTVYLIVETVGLDKNFQVNPSFSLKVKYFHPGMNLDKKLYIPKTNKIDIEFSKTKRGEVSFKWDPILEYENGEFIDELKEVQYKLVYTKNLNINLFSACAYEKNSQVTHLSGDIDSQLRVFTTKVDANEEYNFNVIALLQDQQEVITYQPVTFKIPRRQSNGGWVLLVILVALFLFFAFLALYFYLVGKRIQFRLESEIRDVPNSGSGITTYHAVSK